LRPWLAESADEEPAPSYHGYRFPAEIISHAVWLYHRFCLSFRDAEDLLAQRGVTVTYETIRLCVSNSRFSRWLRIEAPLRGARQSVGDVAPGVTNRAAKPVLRCEIHPGRNGDPSARWLV
jgi:hypothetical protein